MAGQAACEGGEQLDHLQSYVNKYESGDGSLGVIEFLDMIRIYKYGCRLIFRKRGSFSREIVVRTLRLQNRLVIRM